MSDGCLKVKEAVQRLQKLFLQTIRLGGKMWVVEKKHPMARSKAALRHTLMAVLSVAS